VKHLKTFTKKSTHPDYPDAFISHRYTTDGTHIFVTSTGVDGTVWKDQKIIPGQTIKIEILFSVEKISLFGVVSVEGSHSHLDLDELKWLAPLANFTLKEPPQKRVQEVENDRQEYVREILELTDMFKKDGFQVKNVSGKMACALQIVKRGVSLNIWIDQTDKGVRYQVGPTYVLFYTKRPCKKRGTLLDQANLLIMEYAVECITGRDPLFFISKKDSSGVWNSPEIGRHSIVPAEDPVQDANPILKMISSCYFCGRPTSSPTGFFRFDSGSKWELMQKLHIEEEVFDQHELNGTYNNGVLSQAGVVDLLTTGYGINFREKTWVYQLCPECQPLLNLPELDPSISKETNMETVLLLTGRALKTGNEVHGKGCYFCGREEGTDSVNLIRKPDGNFEMLQVALSLKEVIRVPNEGQTFKYFLCPECEILLGLSPRIALTDDKTVGEEPITKLMDQYTDIKNSNKEDFVKKAAALIQSIGAEEFLCQLVGNFQKTGKNV
jgi:hypothetical protein